MNVAHGKLQPNDISLKYIDKDGSGASTVKRMHIYEQGFFIEKWPEGFFDNTIKLNEEMWTARKSKGK